MQPDPAVELPFLHCGTFIHIAYIRPIAIHWLLDSYLFAWLCFCHILCTVLDVYYRIKGFIRTHKQMPGKSKGVEVGWAVTRKLEQRGR